MERQETTSVVDKAGRRGRLGEAVTDRETGTAYITVYLEDGRSILVLDSLLVTRDDGTYYVPVDLNDLEQQRQMRSGTSTTTATDADTIIQADGRIVLPVIEETIAIGKRTVESGRVRVHKRVVEHEELVSDTLNSEQVEVERVPINQIVDRAAGARQDGDTVVIPVYEEMVVVEKRLVLKEEVRLHIRRTTNEWSERVTLRREEIDIERDDAAAIDRDLEG